MFLLTRSWHPLPLAGVMLLISFRPCSAQPPVPARPKPGPVVTTLPPTAGPSLPVAPVTPAPKAVVPMAPPAATPAPTAVATTTKPGAVQKKMLTVELLTKDNVKLRAFYFPSDRGKEAIPVILVHEWQGQASPYTPLVKALWDAGCAIIVPELRGHGGSREYEVNGQKKAFDLTRTPQVHVANMISGDLEATKKYLRTENNAGKLNLNALVLIGVREGAILAAHWTVADLNFPSVGSRKQGQDVKSLILISPEKMLKGLLLDDTLKDQQFCQLPIMIVVGQLSPQFDDTDRFYKKLKIKKRAGKGTAEGLELKLLPTPLSGPALVAEVPMVINDVKTFVQTQMIDNAQRFPWVERE